VRGVPADLAGLRAGGKAALARTLTALETHEDDPALVALLDAAWAAPRGIALGLTGPPGVGKSTLTSALVTRLRARDRTVGVVAVDPSSRRSGGALLGDRTRIDTDPEDQGAFLRSMAARDRLGGLSDLTFPAVALMRALFDWVIVETVGVGQSETDVADVADLVVFCAQPGSGDALQFMKAGIMEVPDVVLVTKGDLGAPAERAATDLKGALSLAAEGAAVPVAVVSAATGAGVDAAIATIEAAAAARGSGGVIARRRARQAAAWGLARLRASFGREGTALLDTTHAREAAPFASLTAQRALFRNALEKVRQSL
jgi:LAO/AO transport system kinase